MDSDDTPSGKRTGTLSRRNLVSAILAGGVAAGVLSPVSGYLRGFAPLSGTVWEAAGDDRVRRLSSPYGGATVRLDDEGVPHVDAESVPAAYFAVGYAQAADRLFQLDLQRRVMRGRLSQVVGPDTLESDEFNVRMGFLDAARATWDQLREESVGDSIRAFADGVNVRINDGPLPMEFGLLDYEPEPWSPVDTMLMEKQISWGLTGSFRTLRLALLDERLGSDVVGELYPSRIPHDAPILREHGGSSPGRTVVSRNVDAPSWNPDAPLDGRARGTVSELSLSEVSRLSRFESPPGVGSNSWVVSGEYTDTGRPMIANDPHLDLSVPPLWYEQHVETPEASVRGVTFPGVPFVIIGANHAGAWGFTNAGADVIDYYTYDVDDEGDRYRYRGEWREFDRKTRRIPVEGQRDRTVEVKRTVHGPMIDRDGRSVAVAWTGLGATRTTRAVFEYARTDGLEDFLEATRRFDLPTQCLVYADRDGRTLFRVTGKVPIRRTDGQPVRGDQVFDGSAGEGEWDGFEPYGQPTWEGFIPFEEMPAAIDPPFLGTANQRVVDDDRYPHYFAASYADGYRGRRVWDLLDERLAENPPVDREFLRSMQLDVRDYRIDDADFLVPAVTDADASPRVRTAGETLSEWDGVMDRDSRGALLFAAWLEAYREVVFEPVFSDVDLGEQYYPGDWVLLTAGPESTLFEGRDRGALAREAMERALDGIDSDHPRFGDADRYGDATHTGVMTHPFGIDALGYPSHETDGSPRTLMNFRPGRPAGSSWRMLCEPGGDCEAILPGGNSGNYYSPHYDDQLRRWADGEYKPMDRELQGTLRFRFSGDDSGDSAADDSGDSAPDTGGDSA